MKIKPIPYKILKAGTVILVTALISMIAVTMYTSQKTGDAAKRVSHSQELLFYAQKLLSLAVDNETGSRGYTITGNKTFLEPLEKSQQEIYNVLLVLKALTNNYPLQQTRIDSLKFYIDKRVAFSKRTISTYNLEGAAGAIAMIETGEGKFYTDQIRFFVYKIQRAGNVLLEQQQLARDRADRRLNNMLIAITIAGILLGIVLLLRFQFISINRKKDELTRNEEKEKKATALIIANRELVFQNEEKEKRAAELEIANKELAFLNTEQQTLFASIVNSSDDAMLTKTTEGIITSWNHGAEKIFGYSAGEIIGKHIFILMPPHLQSEELEIMKQIRSGIKVDHYETERVRKDGTVFNASLTISPVRDFEGNITGASKILRDITERKNATRELEIQEERFRALIENNKGIILLTDDALNSIYRSPSTERITGWSAEDLELKGGINYFHPDDIIVFKTAVAEAIKKTGIPQPYTARYLHKNGHYIWLEGTATKLPDNSLVKGIVFNSLDVTERIELEQLLHKANALARIGSWEVDLIKGTVYWNDITKELHEAESNFVPDLATGLNFYKEGPGRDLITQKVKEAIELGKPWNEELEIVTAKNNERWIRTIGEPEFVDGKCVKIYGSFQDIDQRKIAEEKVMESEEKLRTILQSLFV